MKKHLLTFLIILCITLLFSGCQSRYTDGVAMPESYPEDLIIYEDAVVFEVTEVNDEITITYGTIDNIDDIAEFYNEVSQSSYFIFDKQDETDDYYKASGIGAYYSFKIKAEAPRCRREFKHYDTVVTVTVDAHEESIELKDEMQGTWLYAGQGEISEQNKIIGKAVKIENNSYMLFDNFELIIDESGIFFFEDSIAVKEKGGAIETFNVNAVKKENDCILRINDEMNYVLTEGIMLIKYKELNESFNSIQGFWALVDDENEFAAYEFDGFEFAIFDKLDIVQKGIGYNFIDAETIEYTIDNETKHVHLVFDEEETEKFMFLMSDDESMLFLKTAYDEYAEEVIEIISAETLQNMQGLWQLIGSNGQIPDARGEQGFAYEFTEDSMNVYSSYALVENQVPFYFTDENSIKYIIDNDTKYAEIIFENIAGYEVLTYKDSTADYHFAKTTNEEFYKNADSDDETDDDIKEEIDIYDIEYDFSKANGFWVQVGSSGELKDDDKNLGNAISFEGRTMKIYMDFELYMETDDFEFIDGSTVVFNLSTGKIKAKLEIKNVEGADVLCATILFKEYYFILSSYDNFIQYGESLK